MSKFIQLCRLAGLHPLVGFGMFAADWMLFGPEGASLGITWSISMGVAGALTIPGVLIQRLAMHDSWGLAIGKAALVGVLTAIPTPLPSVLTLIGGTLGVVALLSGRRSSNAEDSAQ